MKLYRVIIALLLALLPNVATATGLQMAVLSATTYSTGETGFGQNLSAGSGFIANLIPSTTATIEARILRNGLPTTVEVAAGSSTWGWVGIAAANGYAIGACGGGGNITTTTNVANNVVHHLELDESSAGCKLYVDGVLAGSQGSAYTSAQSPTNEFAVRNFYGNPGTANAPFNGTVDEVAVWSIVRHSAAFTAPTAPYTGSETGLIALYHLDGDLTDSAATSYTSVAVTDPSMHFSPYNWKGDTGRGGSVYRQTWNGGAYFQFVWTASSTPTAIIRAPSNPGANNVSYIINGKLYDYVPSVGGIVVQGITPSATNTLTVFVRCVTPVCSTGATSTATRWNATSAFVQVQGMYLDTGSTPGMAPSPTCRYLVMGDSNQEGYNNTVGAFNFLGSHIYYIMQQLLVNGCDVGVEAASGTGFLVASTGVPALYNVTSAGYQASTSRWNLIDSGVSLLDSNNHISAYGATGTEPTAIIFIYGTNDAITFPGTTYEAASVQGVLTAYRAAAPAAKIYWTPSYPVVGQSSTGWTTYLPAFNTGTANYRSANPSDTNLITPDVSTVAKTIFSSSQLYSDGNHPNSTGNGLIGTQLMNLIDRSTLTGGGVTQCTGSRSCALVAGSALAGG